MFHVTRIIIRQLNWNLICFQLLWGIKTIWTVQTTLGLKLMGKIEGQNWGAKLRSKIEGDANTMTRNGNQVNFLKFAWKHFVKSHQVNLFLAGFIWNHCVLQEGGEEEEGEGRRLWTDGRTNGSSTLLHMQYTFHYDGNRVNQAWNIEEFYDKIS